MTHRRFMMQSGIVVGLGLLGIATSAKAAHARMDPSCITGCCFCVEWGVCPSSEINLQVQNLCSQECSYGEQDAGAVSCSAEGCDDGADFVQCENPGG